MNSAQAYTSNSDKNDFIFKLGEKYFVFHQDKTDKYYISKNCALKDDCLANMALKKSLPIIQKKLNDSFGKNPGSVICKRLESTTVVIMQDLKGNQQSFCQFSDQSALSTGILAQIYQSNL
jgi:hypothetical protein